MKEFEISKYNPCQEFIDFRNNYSTFKEAWDACPRGDWMLWIASKCNIDMLKLVTAKALCANTVRHLMLDERSTKAIDIAILFGQGVVTIDQLKDAASDAYAAYASAAAKKDNQLQTANICRNILTEEVFRVLNIS